MIDLALLHALATSSPAQWDEIVRRDLVLQKYLAIDGPGVQDVDCCADRLGLSRRMFYRLLKARREAPASTNLFAVLPRGRRVEAAQERIVREAIANVGTSAVQSAVLVHRAFCRKLMSIC